MWDKEIKVLKFLAEMPVWIFEQGGFVGKLFTTLVTSFLFSMPVVLSQGFGWFETYIFSDWSPARSVAIALVIDAITGGWKHRKLGSFSAGTGFVKFTKKFCILAFALFLTNSLPTGDVEGTSYLKTLLYIVAWVYPGLSAFGNIYIVSNKKFPPVWVMENLRSFWDSGDITKLKPKTKDDGTES